MAFNAAGSCLVTFIYSYSYFKKNELIARGELDFDAALRIDGLVFVFLTLFFLTLIYSFI